MIGYININGSDRLLDNKLDYLGHCDNLEILINDEIIFGVKSLNVESLKKEIPCQNKFRGATLFSALKQTHRTEHT